MARRARVCECGVVAVAVLVTACGGQTDRSQRMGGSESGGAEGTATTTAVPGAGGTATASSAPGAGRVPTPEVGALGGTAPEGSTTGGETQDGTADRADNPCGPLIDDMEDGTGRICEGGGRVGVWYAFNDESGAQWPAPTEPGIPIAVSVINGERNGSTRAIHTSGEGFNESGWGAGVGLDLNFDGTTYGTYRASGYIGISFWARSPLSNRIYIRINTERTTSTEYAGTCLSEVDETAPCNTDFIETALTPEWTFHEVFFRDRRCFERGKLTSIQFMSANGATLESEDPFDFWIDDVAFVERPPCCPTPRPGCEDEIVFDDPGLESMVRRATGVVTGPIRCEDLCVVESLGECTKEAGGLGGLECFGGLTSLKHLDLRLIGVRDFSPLEELTSLSSLNSWGSNIPDVAWIRRLTQLTELTLGTNQIRDLAPLAELRQLTHLDLSSNELSDVTPLAQLTHLAELNLSNNQIRDLTPLAQLTTLRQLHLSDNEISDVTPLAALTNMTELHLGWNQISNLAPLAGLTNMTSLNVSYNEVSDYSSLVAHPGLRELVIHGNGPYCDSEALGQLDQQGVLVDPYYRDCRD